MLKPGRTLTIPTGALLEFTRRPPVVVPPGRWSGTREWSTMASVLTETSR
jgi:hypothetical protein